MDETYVLAGGQWKYLYRSVDKLGQTVDFLLTARSDLAAARRFFERAIDLHGVPEKITIEQSGANTAAVRGLVADSGLSAVTHPERGATRSKNTRRWLVKGFPFGVIYRASAEEVLVVAVAHERRRTERWMPRV